MSGIQSRLFWVNFVNFVVELVEWSSFDFFLLSGSTVSQSLLVHNQEIVVSWLHCQGQFGLGGFHLLGSWVVELKRDVGFLHSLL